MSTLRERIDASLPLLSRLKGPRLTDPAHSWHVTRLALALFDQLTEPLALDPSGRDLLAVAALWHDTGQAVRDQGHHKHSYALIMATDLPQFSPLAKAQIACIARYHRKALPSVTHEGYADLPGPARERVRQLAGLLRLADGLDYSHRGLVDDVGVRLNRRIATVTAYAPTDAEAEIERAREKSDLFRQAFDLDIWVRRES